MRNRIIHHQCPACKSAAVSKVFLCKDYTVSQQSFEVWECSNCTLRFTQRVPDANHIGPYYQSADYVSHSDTQKGLVNKLYHWVRKITLRSKRSLIKKETGLEAGRLLDAGAGTGAFAHAMAQAGWSVTGIEPDETARQNAFTNYNLAFDDPAKLIHMNAGSYDVITLWHVLEHVHDLHGYLASFSRLLKPDGLLVIAVPNYTSHDAQVYKNTWAAYDVPRHLYHFSPKSMEALLDSHGFRIEKMKPMWFDSFYVSMLSEKYKNVKGNIIKAIYNGLLTDIKTLKDTRNCSSITYLIRKKI